MRKFLWLVLPALFVWSALAAAQAPSLYTPDPDGLIGEYLFEPTVGTLVRNTISPGTLDGTIFHSLAYPLVNSTDVPFGKPGRGSLDYDALRTLQTTGVGPQAAFAQYVEVPNFPDLPEMTVSMWVKVDYIKSPVAFEDPPQFTYPDNQTGFGACPQPVCKANSWYLFLSTLQTDRNLIYTIIPNNVVQGLPQPATDTQDSGGTVNDEKVHAGQWTHIAATFENIGPDQNKMLTYINGVFSFRENVQNFNGQMQFIPNITSNVIAPSPGQPLRLGQFRSIQANLDYQYSGRLAGVRIYDRAQTPAEVIDDIRTDLAPAVGHAVLTASTPDNDESLWRTANNIARLTFDGDLMGPGTGQVLIQEMLDGGLFGPDLSANFTLTIENDGNGDPRVLSIQQSTPSLSHGKWYAIRNTGRWVGVGCFDVTYVVQMGDASNDGIVSFSDLSYINTGVVTLGAADDDRRDIDGDRDIQFNDLEVANGFVGSFLVSKPSGH